MYGNNLCLAMIIELPVKPVHTTELLSPIHPRCFDIQGRSCLQTLHRSSLCLVFSTQSPRGLQSSFANGLSALAQLLLSHHGFQPRDAIALVELSCLIHVFSISHASVRSSTLGILTTRSLTASIVQQTSPAYVRQVLPTCRLLCP